MNLIETLLVHTTNTFVDIEKTWLGGIKRQIRVSLTPTFLKKSEGDMVFSFPCFMVHGALFCILVPCVHTFSFSFMLIFLKQYRCLWHGLKMCCFCHGLKMCCFCHGLKMCCFCHALKMCCFCHGLKMCCFCHGLKMCISFGYYPQINFYLFFHVCHST